MTTRKLGDIIVSIPIYGDYDYVKPGECTKIYFTMVAIEFTVIVYNSISASLGIAIVRKSSLFHRNMLNLGIVLLTNAYLHLISRSILLLVQFKFLKVEESEFFTGINTIIMFASVLRGYQCMSTVVLFGSLVIERFFATIFLNSYENKKRTWISYSLIFFTITLSFLLGFSNTFISSTFTGEVAISIVRGYTCFPAMIAIVIVFINHRRVNLILLSINYSLGAKYQLKENMRAFKFILLLIVWILSGVGCACLIFLYSDWHSTDLNIIALGGAAYETVTTTTYGCGLTTCLLSQTEWRIALWSKLSRLTLLCRCHSEEKAPAIPSRLPLSFHGNLARCIDDVSSAYFNILFSEWNRVYESRSRQ